MYALTSPKLVPTLDNDYLLSIQANPRLATRRDDDERLPIHWACSYNHFDIAEVLVSRKDFDPDVQDGSGWTPLMIASSLQEGDELVDLLLHKGADVNSKSWFIFESLDFQVEADRHPQQDYSGQTALHFTASKNNLDTARKLIAHKATARVKDRRGQLPLHRAAAVGSVPMTKLLLESQSPVNATDSAGYTALHHGTLSQTPCFLRARPVTDTLVSHRGRSWRCSATALESRGQDRQARR